MPTFFYRTCLLIIILVLTACSSASKKSLNRRFSNDGEGHVEFYCMRCMTGFAVFETDGEEQTTLVQIMLGRRLQDSVESPSRMKRVRITLPAGEHDLVIRLLPMTLVDTQFDVEKGSSRPLHLTVGKNKLTPVRLYFSRISTQSFDWEARKGTPIPLLDNDETIETLTIFLQSSDWDTRWFAAQFLRTMKGNIPKLALMRLESLANWPELQSCLKKNTVIECEDLREEASKTLRQIKRRLR